MLLSSSPCQSLFLSGTGSVCLSIGNAASVVALYRVSDIVPFGARFRVKVPICCVNQCTKKVFEGEMLHCEPSSQ